MTDKQFRNLIIIIVLAGGTWLTVLWHWMKLPEPVIATQEENAVCCSEELMISIYEGTDDLETTYDQVMKHLYKRDSVNHNALLVIEMWEDTLKAESARSLSNKPIMSE
jgi:hypothetical protein